MAPPVTVSPRRASQRRWADPTARAADAPTTSPGDAEPVAPDLAALYEREYAPMVRLAYLLVSSSDVAEDCVQEAFVRVHRRWHRLQRPGAYLRTTVVNACRDHLRRQKVRRAFRPDPVAHDTIPEPDDELAGPLRRLSERRRTAIVLRFYVGMPDEEIAQHLGCRPTTVRSLVHRGLRDLREELES